MRHDFGLLIFVFLSLCSSVRMNGAVVNADDSAIVRGTNAPDTRQGAETSAIAPNATSSMQDTNQALTIQEATGSTIVLMDADTGAVLGGRGERTSNWIASTT